MFKFKKVLPQIKQEQKNGKTVVLATGVFDILHKEHISFLREAKKVGDVLVVGVECDKRVKEIKGEDRPVNNQTQRVNKLHELDISDYVFLLPEAFSEQSDWESFIDELRPEYYAVSSHTKHQDNKRKIMEKFGGELKVVYDHNPEISTSKILERKNGD